MITYPESGHVEYVCTQEHNDGGVGCQFCEGGLFACTTCGAFEGATPDHCPGEKMTPEQRDAVYAGDLNYRDGQWREGECCQVMRPARRRAEFLAEHAVEESP